MKYARGFFVIGLVLMSGYANANSSTSGSQELAAATLGYRNNLGVTKSFSLILKNSEIIVDGLKLNATQKSWAAPYLTRLLQTKSKATLKPCSSGEFTHVVKIHGSESTERGCLESVAFAELNRSFEMLQKQAF